MDDIPPRPIWYDLVSVVVHSGDVSSSRYFIVTRDRRWDITTTIEGCVAFIPSQRWIKITDRQIEPNELCQYFGGREAAVLVVYERNAAK